MNAHEGRKVFHKCLRCIRFDPELAGRACTSAHRLNPSRRRALCRRRDHGNVPHSLCQPVSLCHPRSPRREHPVGEEDDGAFHRSEIIQQLPTASQLSLHRQILRATLTGISLYCVEINTIITNGDKTKVDPQEGRRESWVTPVRHTGFLKDAGDAQGSFEGWNRPQSVSTWFMLMDLLWISSRKVSS